MRGGESTEKLGTTRQKNRLYKGKEIRDQQKTSAFSKVAIGRNKQCSGSDKIGPRGGRKSRFISDTGLKIQSNPRIISEYQRVTFVANTRENDW